MTAVAHEGRTPGSRYSDVSITLHWLTALLIVVQLALGFALGSLERPVRGDALQIHKSIGLTILLLTLARLGWRLAHPWPPLETSMAAWERLLARGTHVGFYVLLLATPLVGWALSSAHGGALRFWGIPFPNLPVARDRNLAETLEGAHEALAWVIVAVLALHVAGALKHHFYDRDATLWRMAPIFRKPSTDPQREKGRLG